MNRKLRNVLFVLIVMTPLACGLARQDAKDVTNKALTYEQIACVLATQISDDATLAAVCQIADDLKPLLRDLVGKRASINQRAGAAWRGSLDGGTTIDRSGTQDAGK